LGAKVLDMVVTFHFFSKLPCIPAGEIAVCFGGLHFTCYSMILCTG
jgi:hypothetical protein